MAYATSIITWSSRKIEELQREENKVWRFILGGQGYVAIEALRGEIGTSCMRVRDMKAKLKYARSAMNGELGSLVKNVLEDMCNKENDEYIRTLKKYMNCIGIVELRGLAT